MQDAGKVAEDAGKVAEDAGKAAEDAGAAVPKKPRILIPKLKPKK